jgi:hypothetical protein
MQINAVVRKTQNLTSVKYNPEELLNNLDIVELAFIPTFDVDSLIRKTAEKHLKRVVISPDKITFSLYHNGSTEILDPPMLGSPGSDAKYYIWNEENGLLLQFIPKYSKTSCHYHEITSEFFSNLAGYCRICSLGVEKILNGNSSIIKPYQCHQLHTSSTPAINLILMNPSGLGKTDHHYLKECVEIINCKR